MMLFDAATASLDRAAFSDAGIHALELRRIFAASWLLVSPATWLAQPGDWLTGRLGAEPVLLWRDAAGELRGFLNRCPRCERPLNEAERGSGIRPACARHPDATGLVHVPHLALHRGLVFANLDPAALPLCDWLAAHAPDFAAAFARPMAAVGEHRLRWSFEGNWKLAMERFCGDFDGGRSAHAATRDATEAGPQPTRALTLLPNLCFESETASLHLWHPVAPDRTEVDTWCLVAADASAAERERARRATQFAWGPAGLLSQDLAVHWQSITETSKRLLARRHALTVRDEAGQRAFYAWWQHRLSAANERLEPGNPMRVVSSEPA